MAILMLQGIVSKKMHSTVCDPGFLKEWLPQIVTDIGMQSVGKPIVEQYKHWEGSTPSAVQFIEAPSTHIPSHTTGVQILTESSITVHCYPDAFFQILLDSCRPIERWHLVRNKIMASLNMTLDYCYYDDRWGWKGATT